MRCGCGQIRPIVMRGFVIARGRLRAGREGVGPCRQTGLHRCDGCEWLMRKSGRRVSHVMVSVAHARCRDFKMQNVTSWVAPRGALPISRSGVVQDCAVGVMQDVARGLAAATSHALSAPCVLDSSACVYDLPSTISWC
jgi:hypothetical protein